MPITREIGFGAVARTGRQELRDYGIVRVSDRLRWALLEDSPLIEHRDLSGNQKGAVKVVGTTRIVAPVFRLRLTINSLT